MKRWIAEQVAAFKAWCRRAWKAVTAVIVAFLASFGLMVVAQDVSVTLSWENATSYENGDPLPLSEIAETRLYRSQYAIGATPDGTATPTQIATVTPDVTTYVDNPGSGQWCYYGTHVAANGLESVPSGEVCITRDERRPGAPQNLTLQ